MSKEETIATTIENLKTFTITTLEVQNNYLKIGGSIDSGIKGEKARSVTYYYPKSTTNFSEFQTLIESAKGTIYSTFYQLNNHFTNGKIIISSLLVSRITQGTEGKAFDTSTFVDFCTKETAS